MRYSKAFGMAAALALTLAVGACESGLPTNVDPNSPNDVGSEFLLRQGLQTAVGNVVGTGVSINHAGLWVQHVAQIQYAEEDRYQPRADFFQGLWDGLYAGPLKDFEAIIEKSQASDRPAQEAVALIMKSWTFGAMTDMWGDLPYSEALKGDVGNFTPKYDTQEAIYNGLFADLKKANDLLADATTTGFGTADLIYGGNAEKWRRFANSLRLRLAMHLQKRDPAKAQAEFEAAVATGFLIDGNANNAKLQYTGASPNQNPYYLLTFVTGRDDHRVSITMVNMLKGLNDPRLPIYVQPAKSSGEYVGYGNGLPNNSSKLDDVSRIGSAFLAAGAPLYLMTFAEVQFLLAEAARLGWTTGGDDETFYHAGVEAALKMYGVEDAAVTAYIAQAEVNYASVADKARAISEQKWLALYLQGYEAWAEWRRTGYPVIEPGPNARAGGVPRRYRYPTLESSLNKTNLQEAEARQGDTDLTGRIWWDKE